MKAILTVFFSIITVACFPGGFSKSVLKCCNGPDLDSTSEKILLVVNSRTGLDQSSIESCINGVEITLDLHSQSKIADIIFVEKKPGLKLIKELQKKYSVTGLLFLSRLKMKRSAKDVPGDQIEYTDNRMPEPYLEITERVLPWTNLYVEITSKWKYYDLNSGKQFDFEIKNKKIFELRRYVSNIDSLIDANQTMFDPLLYENGKIMAEKLLKAKTND